MKRLLALSLLIAAPTVATDVAFGQDDIEDLDEDRSRRTRKRERQAVTAALETEVVREIEKGFFLKAGVGTAFYLLRYAANVSSGTGLELSVGQDFVDNEKNSMGWEFAFAQGTHNGMRFENQPAAGIPASSYIQGDVRSFAFLGLYEASFYPARRVGLGVRVGGGVMFTPLLMDREAYLRDVVQDTWRLSAEPSVHRTPHPMVQAGPTFEYYTKLSHFSIGIDLDVLYAVGFDLGARGAGYFKYSF